MNEIFKHYSDADKKLVNEITKNNNQRNFYISLEIIKKRLESLQNCNTNGDLLLKIDLAGFLIDIGEEGGIKQAALEGLKLIEDERENIKGLISESSIEYNLGNAKNTLFKIENEENGAHYYAKDIGYLIESKNHYWRAYKIDFDERGNINPLAMVNLANTLSLCGRTVESLQFYDRVLEKYPSFPQANASLAKELIWLKNLSGGFTQSMIYKAYMGYYTASKAKGIPDWLIKIWQLESERLKKFLNDIKFDDTTIHKELEETRNEYQALSPYRKFCITNHLTLSEHSLYCNCAGSRRDDLLICTPNEAFDSELIPLMEKILNRLKSEYSFARLLYFNAIQDIDSEMTMYDNEVMFTELYDSEYLGTKSEMIRTSFRLCFGILDKIARAVCLMFDLADKDEQIYFESFWNPKKKHPSEKQKTRWDKINSIDNISLLALYTQATDLNSKSGEWSFYKSWRNALEHNQLTLMSNNENNSDIFKIYRNNPSLVTVDKNYFTNKTLHLLQLTRSAIFNFVFLVRNEVRKTKMEYGKAIEHTFTFKNDKEK